MLFSSILEGLQIFRKYFVLDGYYVSAYHQEIRILPTSTPIYVGTDLERLYDLGWRQEGDNRDDPDSPKPYDSIKGWIAHP